MKLRTFTADDMQLAMQMVRDELGDDAIIISTKQADKKGSVQVVAACDDEGEYLDENYDEWFATLSEGVSNNGSLNKSPNFDEKNKNHEPPYEHGNASLKIAKTIEKLLAHHGVNKATIKYLMDKLEGISALDTQRFAHYEDKNKQWFAALINAAFKISPINPIDDSTRHILVGAQGAGKTLTAAKIAAHCVKYNQPIHVITVDNNKAGGVQQLAAITDILGVELQVADSRRMLQSMISEIPLAHSVIVDSAGANPYDFHELKELAQYANLLELDPVLVYAAGGDPMEADEIARAFSFMGVEKMIITRTDAARRFGGVLNAAAGANLKLANITGTEKILGTFDNFNAEIITKLFFDYQPIGELKEILA